MIQVLIKTKDIRPSIHQESFGPAQWKEIGELIAAWLLVNKTKCVISIEY